MKKTLSILAALAIALPLTACGGDDDTTVTVTTGGAETSTTSTTSTGSTTSSTTSTTSTTTSSTEDETGEDVSGNCDEAEHASDPECTGGVGSDDNSGSGSGGTPSG